MTIVEQRAPRVGVGLALGLLEGEQDAAADLERVLEALETGRERLPVLVAEIGVARAGREHEVVVAEAAVFQHELVRRDVDRHGLREQHAGVGLAAQDGADRVRDVGGREPGSRDLVEQRLEEMVVAAVDERHVHRRAAERLGGGEAAEAAADDHDVRAIVRQPGVPVVGVMGLIM